MEERYSRDDSSENKPELVIQENEYRDKNGVLRFAVPQIYVLPINELRDEDTSVTYSRIECPAGIGVLRFYHAFRRYLNKYRISPLRYCYLANILEVLQCVKYPEGK